MKVSVANPQNIDESLLFLRLYEFFDRLSHSPVPLDHHVLPTLDSGQGTVSDAKKAIFLLPIFRVTRVGVSLNLHGTILFCRNMFLTEV